MEFTGRIILVLPARSGVSQKGTDWMTQEYVIEESNAQYPKRMCFNVFGEDKIKQMNIQVNQELTVSFDINAREYQGRWFNDLRAWKVENALPAQPQPQQAQAQQPQPQLTPEQQQTVNMVKDAFEAEQVDPNDPKLPF